MKILKTLMFGAAAFLLASSTALASVVVTIHDGRVSIVAKDATIRQILTEWARVGQTKIVNLERIAGGPMSIELHDVPESQALDVLLRSVAGYLAAPRPVAAANLSVFDRVVVMPQPAGARVPVTSVAAQPPTFQQPPQFNRMPPPADDDDDRATPNGITNQNQNRGPVFNTFPQPQQMNNLQGVNPNVMQPAQQAAPSAFPTAPYGGVAVPGMVAPAPPQPGLPGLVPGQVPGQQPGTIRPGGQ
jgi:hypothetical protein